jgi:glycosyltransferase involved in cell wall biosynthesis
MRILFADLDREWRGGQSQALLTLRGLGDAGHDVTLLAAKDAPLATRSAAAQIQVVEIPRATLRLSAAKSFRSIIRKHRFDLVHLNEPHALSAAWLAGVHKHLPLLLSRRIGFPLKKNLVSQARYRAVTRFLPNSRAVAQSLIDSGIAASRISVVNEGVEIPALTTPQIRAASRLAYGIAENEFLFGCVSVFVKEKGQRHLIAALPQVRATHPATRLLLAGDGACRGELESLARELRQSHAVLFPGFVQNVDAVYAALDAFAFPSEFEGLGTALQTAMALALPCISTARGALGEVVENNRTALVVEPTAEDFAAAMVRVIEDPALRARLGTAAREEVRRRFSAERMVENTVKVYGEVLAEQRTAKRA